MLAVNQLCGFGAEVLPVPVLTYRGTAETETDLQNFTSGSISIGTASGYRWVIVCCYGSSYPVTSITASATSNTFTRLVSFDSDRVQLWVGYVPEGTTSTFTMNGSGTQARQGLAVWTVGGLNFPQLIDSVTGTTAAGGSLNVNVVEGGFVICYGFGNTTPTFTWTGVTKDFETTIGTNVDHSGGHIDLAPQATPRSVSVSISGASTSRYFAASMR